jgi:hypothetical protein
MSNPNSSNGTTDQKNQGIITGAQQPANKIRLYPPAPKDFNPFAASNRELMVLGLPPRPDAKEQPGLAALWERQAARYRHFEHIQAKPDFTKTITKADVLPAIGPSPLESCGFSLFNSSAPITSLFCTWTVPDLHFTPGGAFGPNHFHTFVSLGFLDIHVEMTVDSAQNVTSRLLAQGVGEINMPVRPGDVISGSLCLQANAAGTASYFLANETTSQTINFVFDTGFPPAVTISAGVTRSSGPIAQPSPPLARFGIVYFDELSAFSTQGSRSLTSGQAITMVDRNGKKLASPTKLNDFAFKATFESA